MQKLPIYPIALLILMLAKNTSNCQLTNEKAECVIHGKVVCRIFCNFAGPAVLQFLREARKIIAVLL
ncbi:Uncharacterised protein [uncultured archaeon]|nr:Uncharacterised protein [uncultured archaeon]